MSNGRLNLWFRTTVVICTVLILTIAIQLAGVFDSSSETATAKQASASAAEENPFLSFINELAGSSIPETAHLETPDQNADIKATLPSQSDLEFDFSNLMGSNYSSGADIGFQLETIGEPRSR